MADKAAAELRGGLLHESKHGSCWTVPVIDEGDELVHITSLGDWQVGYVIADRIGIRVLRDPYSNKPYVHFYTTKRVGGGLLDSNAIKLLRISA